MYGFMNRTYLYYLLIIPLAFFWPLLHFAIFVLRFGRTPADSVLVFLPMGVVSAFALTFMLKRNQSGRRKRWTIFGVNAEIAVIASRKLPDEIKHFGSIQGEWVTDWLYASQLASALRMILVQVSENAKTYEGREHKIELMYDYLTSTQFKQRIEGIVDSFQRMREDLAQEKQAILRMWSKREKQLELITQGTAGLYGDIQGIAGAVIPEIEALQMPYQLESGGQD